jgi:hypothetical protein
MGDSSGHKHATTRYMPHDPIKYGPLWNIKSLYSLNSNKSTKKPLPQKEEETFPFMRGFHILSIQLETSLWDGQILINYLVRPLVAKQRDKFLDKEV